MRPRSPGKGKNRNIGLNDISLASSLLSAKSFLKKKIAFASGIFNSIEINGTFYSLQRPESFARWAAKTPANFIFAKDGLATAFPKIASLAFLRGFRQVLQARVQGKLCVFRGLWSLRHRGQGTFLREDFKKYRD
jgi:hypothetical protein